MRRIEWWFEGLRSLQAGAFIAVAAALLLSLAGCTQQQGSSEKRVAPTNAAGVTDLLSEVRKRGKLIISTDANYQPLSYRTSDGAWRGFDIDVGREIARRLGVSPEFLDINFDVTTSGNWNGRWDLNIDSMTVTHDRQRVLYFTEPYYYIPAAFVVHKNNTLKSIEGLAGKRVGVGTATTYQAYLEGHLTLTGENILVPAPAARAIPYDTDQLALRDLALGDGVRLDAVLTSWPFAAFQIKSGQPFRELGQAVFYEEAAVAIDKNSPLDPKSFYQATEQAVEGMHKDGTLSRLSKQNFGADFTHK
ncbi:MAG TPA: transporter substrate-binding domain-containing protein [Candidatus Acidoferrales bacterium]|nr:transporter substrate-binding domain-containing protein [Candidatus Acidoferrales bacterium]